MEKAMIIYNPTAGNESGKDYAEKLEERLNSEFENVILKETQKEKDATDFAFEACEKEYDSIFAIGGDGTINEVINGMVKSKGDNKPTLGIIPGGTFNGLARVLKIPLSANKAIEEIDLSKHEPLDIATTNGDAFLLNFNFGDIPRSIQSVSIEDKTKFAVLSYVINAIKESSKNTHYQLKITLDDDTVIQDEFSHVIVTLSSVLDEFNFVDKEVERADGKLHLLLYKNGDFVSKLSLIPNLIKGDVDKNEDIKYLQAEKIKIETLDNTEVQTGVDGDTSHKLPVELKLLPKAINVYTLVE